MRRPSTSLHGVGMALDGKVVERLILVVRRSMGTKGPIGRYGGMEVALVRMGSRYWHRKRMCWVLVGREFWRLLSTACDVHVMHFRYLSGN